MTEIDPEIIKKTQDTLGKFIKKPPLTEKLLSRPPFRFLHDIITAVISSTGFMKDLFTDFEMNSENVKEKEAKLVFLDKFIGMVSLVLNKPIDVRASSIVAGKESEKTNVLLQCLGKAISKKVDNASYVKRVMSGEAKKLSSSKSNTSKEKPVDKTSSKSKTNEKSNEEQKNLEKTKQKKSNNSLENGSNTEVTKPHQSAKSRKSSDNNVDENKTEKISTEKNESEITKDKDAKKPSKAPRTRSNKVESGDNIIKENVSESKAPTKESQNEVVNEEMKMLNEDADLESLKRLQRPSSAKGTRHRHENDHHMLSEVKDVENNSKRSMVRPPSARPAPPKPRKSSDANLDEGVNIVSNQTRVSGLIVDNDQDSDEGDFIVEEFVGGGDIDMKFAHSNVDNAIDDDATPGTHGALVTKIIQSKKDFTTSDEKSEILSHADTTRKRERLNNEKEVEKIRQNLQSLTKSVNPLGKLIDFIQEDLDTMQKEADRWRLENDELDTKLQSEQNLTNKLMKPIREKLNEETKMISIQGEAIAKLKAKIETNSKKIETMLFNVCSAAS